MGRREERRVAAEARRKAWRQRWAELAQSRYMKGASFKDCIRLIALDADHLVRTSPPLKSEILLAMEEFTTNLTAAILIVQEESHEV